MCRINQTVEESLAKITQIRVAVRKELEKISSAMFTSFRKSIGAVCQNLVGCFHTDQCKGITANVQASVIEELESRPQELEDGARKDG